LQRDTVPSPVDGRPIQDECLIVDGGRLAGTGAHSYSAGVATFSNSRRARTHSGGYLVGRWKKFQQVEDPATAATLFGSGGSYDVDSLRLRAAMIDEVKAEVELARQDLAALAAGLLR